MKKVMCSALTVMMFVCLFCMPVTAEESSPHSVYGLAAFGTDYYSRGISITENLPSIQAEIGYEHDSGFYAGIWGGNISGDSEYVDDYDNWTYATDEGNLELDFWVG